MIKYSANLSQEFEKNILENISTIITTAIQKQKIQSPEWINLADAAKYANVSYNTFIKFRTLGLKVCEIEGIKRVSKKEIDRFLEEHSF